jgi:hypothetical protein
MTVPGAPLQTQFGLAAIPRWNGRTEIGRSSMDGKFKAVFETRDQAVNLNDFFEDLREGSGGLRESCGGRWSCMFIRRTATEKYELVLK